MCHSPLMDVEEEDENGPAAPRTHGSKSERGPPFEKELKPLRYCYKLSLVCIVFFLKQKITRDIAFTTSRDRAFTVIPFQHMHFS